MGCYSNWPNFNLLIDQAFGGPQFEWAGFGLSGASNIVSGSNPPYTATDFLSFYPKFGGTPLAIANCGLSAGSQIVQLPDPIPGLAAGQLVTGLGIAQGALVQSYTQNQSSATLTLSATQTAEGVSLNFFVSTFVPIVVLNAYIALASASLVQARYCEMWSIAMGLYVAHFATLYLRSDGDVYSTPGRAAAAGLQRGITISKTAGPVSQSIQPITGLDDWAGWTETEYGIQLATFAKVVGAGPMLIW